MVTNTVLPISAHIICYDVVFGRPNSSLVHVATITSANTLNDALNNPAPIPFRVLWQGNLAAKSLHCPKALLFELILNLKRWVMKPGTLLQLYYKMHDLWIQLTRWSKSCMLQVWGGPQVVRQKSKLLPWLFPSPSLSSSACPMKKDKSSGKKSKKMHSNMQVSK